MSKPQIPEGFEEKTETFLVAVNYVVGPRDSDGNPDIRVPFTPRVFDSFIADVVNDLPTMGSIPAIFAALKKSKEPGALISIALCEMFNAALGPEDKG